MTFCPVTGTSFTHALESIRSPTWEAFVSRLEIKDYGYGAVRLRRSAGSAMTLGCGLTDAAQFYRLRTEAAERARTSLGSDSLRSPNRGLRRIPAWSVSAQSSWCIERGDRILSIAS